MSDYAYPYDPTGTNPECLVVGEQHALANYPNKWGCVIPQFAPFYRKDLTIRHVEEDRELHEGIDYYLGHYYKKASVENKMPIFGSVMIIDQTLSGTLEFTKYRTLGGRYNMLQRVIDVHLNQVDLGDPRNLDWEDVIRYEMAVPAVDAPDNRVDAIANDPITGGLDRIRKAIERLNEAKKTGFDDVIARLIALGDKIHDHDIDQHEHRRGVHRITHTQLGALHKDATAVDALKAYGYTLAELVTLVNLLGENAEDTQDLFRLIGDSLEGSLRFEGDSVIIQNEGGSSIINLNTGDIEILSSGDVTFRADDKANDNGVTASLRSGDNLLTLHSYVGDCKPAVIHNSDRTFTERPHPTCRQISSAPAFATTNGRVFAYKRIYFPGGDVSFGIMSDNSYQLYIDGVSMLSGSAYPTTVRNTVNVAEGYHWVSVLCVNGSGPSFMSFSFEKDSTVYSVSDESWFVRDVSGLTTADFVTEYPHAVDASAVFNGFYLIHVGNIVDFLPPPDYVDTILHVDTTDTVFLTGRGISTSPLTGYVFYPIATETSKGVFKLNHSIFSSLTKDAASINAVSKLKNFVDTKVDNTLSINGHRLNSDIVITAEDIGLGKVDNTAPEDKPASIAFKDEASHKANAGHTHDPSDFTNPPLADETTLGLTKLTTTHSERTDIAATPVMLNEAYLDQLRTESNLNGKMPTAPFNIMQYGGFGYLPIPVQGSYGAAGINTSSYATVGLIESDGQLVCLRNGKDIYEKGVYYWYADFKSDGTLAKVVSTTIQYRPSFLPDGVDIEYVMRGSEAVFIARCTDGQFRVILTRGTMDSSKHVGSVINLSGVATSHGAHTFIYKNSVYTVGHYAGNSGINCKLWRFSISDIEAGREIVPTQLLLSGVDWNGDTQTDQPTFYYTKVGHSTDPANNPICLRQDNGKYTGANVRHSSLNSSAAVQDSKVRIFTYSRSYFSYSGGSTGWAYRHSYTIDLETLITEFDNRDAFPWICHENGSHTSPVGSIGEGGGFPAASPNNTTPTFHSRGRMFCVRFYGTAYVPHMYEYKPTDGSANLFEHLNANTLSQQSVWGHVLSGSYGSVACSAPKYLGFLSGNNMIMTQSPNGPMRAKYDPAGSYLDDGSGFGPTPDRQLLSEVGASLGELNMIPRLWDEDANMGAVLSNGGLSRNSIITGTDASDPISLPQGIYDQLLTEFRAIYSDRTSTNAAGDRIVLSVFGDWRTGNVTAFLQYACMQWQDDERTRRYGYFSLHQATISMAGGSIASCTIGPVVNDSAFSSTAVSLGSLTVFGMNHKVGLDNGNTLYIMNNSAYIGYVGHGGGRAYAVIVDSSGTVIWNMHTTVHTHTMYGLHYEPNIGYFSASLDSSGEAVVATKYGTNTAEIMSGNNLGNEYIHATRVASGWIIYFTEEVRFFVNGESVILPVQNFDISKIPEFPNYQNKTFYIYVTAETVVGEGTIGKYVLSEELTEDTETSMYIGYAKTDDIQIVDLKVDRATRLGTIYELEQHTQDPRAHNDITNLDKYSFSLGNVENMGMIHTLTLPTFREIFDTWKRISHLETTEAQPANETELKSWQYNESNDSIICPINSATFVGFVSPGEVGDYVFDTLVGSPGADNDGVVIILAYKVDENGKEHTLCATRSRSTEGHMMVSGKFDIWYNYKQSSRKLIATGGGTSNDGVWDGNYSRITAVRDGDQFAVTATKFVKSTDLTDHGADKFEGAHTFNIIDHPELAIFKSGGSFGYGCISQPYSTFANILRPDEQVGNYYASADTIRILSEKQAESVKFATGLVAGGASVPIPAGFVAADCSVVLSFNTLTNAGKLTYAKAELAGMVCNITTRVSGGALVTNAPGSNARYHLIARKRPEV